MDTFSTWLLNEETYRYSCVMTDLKDAEAFIAKWSAKNIKTSDLDKEAGGREKTSHVTALYGLRTKTPDTVEQAIEKVRPFTVKFGKVSKFSSTNYDVIKIDVSSSALLSLNRLLKRLPHHVDFPKYVPHCTIAYVKKGSCDHLIGNTDFSGKTYYVDGLTFSSPEGRKSNLTLG